MITLYSKNGTEIVSGIKKFSYNGSFMGECFINTTINSDSPIDFNIGDYCVFRGERFELNYIPAKRKTAKVGMHGSAFTYDNIKFNSLADETTTVEFLDVVIQDNEIHGTSLPNFSFYANSVQDLADRIKANLDRVFTGDKSWTVVVLPDLVSPSKNISVSKISVWDAISMIYSEFNVNFIIRNRTITIGTSGYAVGAVFGYGKGSGLYDIQQATNQDAKIITRLRAFGSTRNIPHRYYNNLRDENNNPYILESLYIPNLMLPNFPYTVNQPKDVFIDSVNKDVYGIREGSIFFDGSDSELSEIYPSLEGMTAQQLSDAGITVSLPVGDNGHIDEILGAKNPDDDGIVPIEGQGKIAKTFKIYLKDLGFDLSEKDSDGQYKYETSDTMQISMTSGACGSRTFDIVDGGIKKDTSLGYTRYVIECDRFTDDSIQGGTAFPNSISQIKAGDKFVILGIDMPDVYVKAASQRLSEAAEEYLSQNDSTKYTYTPKIDEILMAQNQDLGYSIKEGDIFSFEDTDLEIDASVIIQSLKINYDVDKQPIPSYEVALSNDRISTSIEKMQNAISMLQSNISGLSIDTIKSLINSVGTSLFLSKNFNDTAKGLIKFTRGLDIGDYSSGAFGGGGTLRMNSNNQSYLEVDKLYVRMQAVFKELLIERLSHIGGSLVISPARMICSSMEELNNAYRCYFDTGENNEFVQQFVVGDQARCQVFIGSTLKYYWRLVINIGDNYIDLSKTDADSNSQIPEAGDHIVQLGNRTDVTRQNAQVLSSFGEDAPSYKQYQGIDSYSLEGKEKTVISPSGNEFDGKVTIKEGSLGWENLVGLPEAFQNLSTGAVNLIRNSGFTGEYTSKNLSPDTKLKVDTPMFSENLAFWSGNAVVNSDSESTSGFSVTLFDDTLSQPIPTINNENYILTFKAKGSEVNFNISGVLKTQELTSSYKRYVIKLTASDTQMLTITGRCTLCEIQLERGTIPSEWSPSPLDNDKTLAQFESIRYITDSVKNGTTTIMGGLILSSLIQVGNYINNVMDKVTAGMSGIYNDDRDVAFWAGGDLMRATANAIEPNTNDEEKMINFLVTHGGLLIANNAIIRGHITATSGSIGGFDIKDNAIQSQSKSDDGEPAIYLNGHDGSGWLANKNISWDELGNPVVNGRFTSTDNEGNRIEVDAGNKAIRLYTSEGYLMGIWSYSTPSESNFWGSIITLRNYEKIDGLTFKFREAEYSAGGMRLSWYGANGAKTRETKFSNTNNTVAGSTTTFDTQLIFNNLPTSPDKLPKGQVWCDGNTLKIIP